MVLLLFLSYTNCVKKCCGFVKLLGVSEFIFGVFWGFGSNMVQFGAYLTQMGVVSTT
jgi:hypothetical protein